MKLGKFEKWIVTRVSHGERTAAKAEKLMQYLRIKEDRKFLEIGCGAGAVSKFIAEKYRVQVTGIDLDPDLIELAKKNVGSMGNINFQVCDATNLPFEDKEFDIILTFGVMHHIQNWTDAFKEIRRVLKPYGHFIYSDLVYYDWAAKIVRKLKTKYGVTNFPFIYSFFRENNFSTIHTSLKRSPFWYWYSTVCVSGGE